MAVESRHEVSTRSGNDEVINRFLFHRPIEDRIDYIESDHAAADDGAGRDGAPQHVRAGELPDCQQARDDGDQDAAARRPERNLCDDAWIEEASFHWSRQFSWIQ